MMIQIYSKLVLLLDVCYFLVYSVWAIVQTLFLVLFPSKLKSLQDEVVVVSVPKDIFNLNPFIIGLPVV